jgi:hypothetical protein
MVKLATQSGPCLTYFTEREKLWDVSLAVR